MKGFWKTWKTEELLAQSKCCKTQIYIYYFILCCEWILWKFLKWKLIRLENILKKKITFLTLVFWIHAAQILLWICVYKVFLKKYCVPSLQHMYRVQNYNLKYPIIQSTYISTSNISYNSNLDISPRLGLIWYAWKIGSFNWQWFHILKTKSKLKYYTSEKKILGTV